MINKEETSLGTIIPPSNTKNKYEGRVHKEVFNAMRVVIWRDSTRIGDGWIPLSSVEDFGDVLITSVGIVVCSNPDSVTISTSVGGNLCVDPLVIPRKSIVSMYTINVNLDGKPRESQSSEQREISEK